MARVLTSVGYCLLFIRVLSQSFKSPTIPGQFIIDIDEDVRQERILLRGKSKLDKLLDDEIIRKKFLKEFAELSEHYVQISNGNTLEELYFNAQKALAKRL